MSSLDFSKDNLDRHNKVYGVLLCDRCKEKLEMRCSPILEKLNKGFPPSPREMLLLLNSLCRKCHKKLLNKKQEEKEK